jgi:hypothetical protein
MPIRMIRDWTSSSKVNKLSSQSERFLIRLMMKADDFGNYPAGVKFINGTLFPEKEDIRDIDVAKWMDECSEVGLIKRYTVDEKRYLHIIDFGQRLDKARPKYPQPHEDPDFVANPPENADHADTPEYSRNIPGTIPAELETETEYETEKETEKRVTAPDSNPFPFETEEHAAWCEWVQYRKEKKQKLTPSTVRKQIQFLAGRAGPEIVEIINQSITNGWTGLFEPKNNGKQQQPSANKHQQHTASLVESYAKTYGAIPPGGPDGSG